MELSELSNYNKEILVKKFIEEVILPQWKQLSTWNALTSQTAQLDFGYLSQHLVSLISGIEGKGQRGKGDDLSDGSEVKSASCVNAIDTPRWNNVNCGTQTVTELKSKFKSIPFLFFVLLDTTKRGGNILRCRIWCVRPKDDKNFMNVLINWAKENDDNLKNGIKLKTNLQLHPPRWDKAEENITTNIMGNLKLPLIYQSEQFDIPGILVMETKIFKPELIQKGLSERVARE